MHCTPCSAAHCAWNRIRKAGGRGEGVLRCDTGTEILFSMHGVTAHIYARRMLLYVGWGAHLVFLSLSCCRFPHAILFSGGVTIPIPSLPLYMDIDEHTVHAAFPSFPTAVVRRDCTAQSAPCPMAYLLYKTSLKYPLAAGSPTALFWISTQSDPRR